MSFMDWIDSCLHTQATAPQSPTPRNAPEIKIPEWVPEHDDWERITACHCGCVRNNALNGLQVCPRCGHTDKWETFIGRMEWEQLRHPGQAFPSLGLYSYSWNEERNRRIVRWTEDSCSVPTEAKQ